MLMLKKNNLTLQQLFSIIILIFMWIIFAGNTSNPDYNNFEHIYNKITIGGLESYSGVEIGFSIIMKLSGIFGFSYQQFLIILSTVFLILLLKFIFYFSKSPALVLLIYIFFPFFLDIVQIRNSLAYIIVLNGIIYLYNKKNISYILIILLASLFHTTALFNLIFLLINFVDPKKLLKIIVPTSIFLYLIKSEVINLMIKILPIGDKYVVYLNGTSILNQLLYLILILGNFIIVYYTFLKVKKLGINNKIDTNIIKLASFSLSASILVIMILPLLSFDADFFRLFRNLILIFIINFCNYLSIKKYIKNEIYLFIDCVGVISFILVGVNYLYYYQFDKVFMQIINNNFILEMG